MVENVALGVYFILRNNDSDEYMEIKYKEGAQEEIEDFAKQESEKYLKLSDDLVEVNWIVVSEISSGFVSK